MALNIKKDFGTNRALAGRKPDLTTLVYGKVPPQTPECEEAVLGAAMLEKDTFYQLQEIIPSEDCFYVDAHQKIYAAMRRLTQKSTPVDLITITEELRKTNELEIVGGAYYLTRLTMSVLSSAHIEAHARLVMEKFMQREMIRISGHTINRAYEDDTDVFDLIDWQSNELHYLQTHHVTKAPVGISEVVKESLDRMEFLKNSDDDFTGIYAGSEQMNQLTKGWQDTDLIILAARPSVGKTAFAINKVLWASLKGTPTAMFSLEMGKRQIVERMKAAVSGVNLESIKSPKLLTTEEWERVNRAATFISKLPIFIEDKAGLTISEMKTKVRILTQKHGVKFIILDYLQLMQGEGGEGNREREISKISRDLKVIAMTYNLPLLALSQLNRAMEGQNGTASRSPRLSDLRESGSIEQDADGVFFLYEPTPRLIEMSGFFMGKTAVECAKGRNTGTGIIAMEFNKDNQRWKDPNTDGEFYPKPPPDNPSAGMPTRLPYKDSDTNPF